METTNQQTPEPKTTEPNANQSADEQKDINDNRAVAYLSYLGILFLVPLLVKRDSPFVLFHAKQGLVLMIGWMIGTAAMPLLGVGAIIYIAVIILSIMGLLNVQDGKKKELPIVGNLAKKFNI